MQTCCICQNEPRGLHTLNISDVSPETIDIRTLLCIRLERQGKENDIHKTEPVKDTVHRNWFHIRSLE